MTLQPRPTSLLDAQGLAFRYNGKPILRDVSFHVEPGEFVGLVGPNGAGKSTLLRVISGLLTGCSAGTIRLLDRALTGYSPREVARLIAHVPQSTVLDFPFTVQEVVLMGRSPYLGRFQVEGAGDRAIAQQAMAAAGVLEFADRYINTLSGGERQRALIARALAQQPRILLLDEPTSNLDIRHQLTLLDLVQALAHEQGLGVVAAIHDLALAARYCDRIVLLDGGQVAADGVPSAVFTPHRLARVFGVEVTVEQEPESGDLRLTPLRPAS